MPPYQTPYVTPHILHKNYAQAHDAEAFGNSELTAALYMYREKKQTVAHSDRAWPRLVQSTPSSKDEGSTLGLHAIPGFAGIVLDAIRDVASTRLLGKVAPIDVGVVCDGSAVRALGRAIHDRVRARLKD